MENVKIYKCRLCLNSTSKKVEIFKHDFPKMIELLTGLKPDPNDGLPKESCMDCAKDVKFCMSVRKQILLSYKTLIKKLVEEKVLGHLASQKPEERNAVQSTEQKIPEKRKAAPKRFTRRRRTKSDSTSDDEFYENYSEYSDSEIIDNTVTETENLATTDSVKVNQNIIEQITLIHDVETKVEEAREPVGKLELKSEEVELAAAELKTEDAVHITEPTSVQPALSAKRLLKKQKMIAASNHILEQGKSGGDRRYSNVIFIRKSAREKLRKQEDNNSIKPKKRKLQTEERNIIWKNGKKYASCDICKKEVKLHYMKHHMTTHFPEHFSCDVCGVTTRNMRGLRYHKMYWHSSKLDYICDQCGKKYRSKHALDLHNKKEHGGVRDLECNICGKKFFQKMHLKRHVDGIHKKLRPHKCEYCGKDFSKRTHLVTHWRTHTNETPYGCDMCGERFKLKLSLKNHLRRAHNFEEKESVFCNVCHRGFTSEQGLRAHINSRVHEGEKCQYCSESFTPEYLKVHLREVHFHVDFF